MAELNTENFTDIYVNDSFHKYHGNDDTSFSCSNNIIKYSGDTKYISGFVGVVKGEQKNLGSYPVRRIDPGVWKLEPHLLFFNLRESINLYKADASVIRGKIYNFLSLASKNNLNDYEKTKLIEEIDLYIALKKTQNTLRDELYDYYKCFNDIVVPRIINLKENEMSEGFKIIYERLYSLVAQDYKKEEIISNANQENNTGASNETGYVRTRIGAAGKQSKVMPIHFDDDNNYLSDKVAYISIKTVSIIVAVLTAIFALLLILM